jgi:purine-nucleoside phosphorylase
MSLHIGASAGAVASTILITGDPLRAKHFAETTLKEVDCFNRIRGMFGYTGFYNSTRVSIMGTGIGIPSTALYVHELIHTYQVKNIIRLGTTGAIQTHVALGDIILANQSQTDSGAVAQVNQQPIQKASIKLLKQAQQTAQQLQWPVHVGSVFSTDLFYRDDDATRWMQPAQQGMLSVDMETAMLYAMGTKHAIDCLAILTVSDHIMTGAVSTAQHRERPTSHMLMLALRVAEKLS